MRVLASAGFVLAALVLANAADAPAASPAPGGSACPETQPSVVKAADPVYPAATMKFVQSPISVQVMVMVSNTGSVASAAIAQSSGYADVDAAALKAAMASSYKPRTVDCKPAQGLYLFNASFTPH